MLTHGIKTYPLINPFHWGYNGSVEEHVSEKGSVEISLKDSKETIPFNEFVQQHVPALKDGAKFRLDPKIFTGILQTMYLSAADFSKSFPNFYGREIVQFEDGVCTADWVRSDWSTKYNQDKTTGKFDIEKFNKDEAETHPDNWPRLHPRTRYMSESELKETHDDTRPVVIIMHGLAGGSHEPIIRSLAMHLSQIDNGRFQVVVLNTRGCARSKITTHALFTGLHTGDIEHFALREKERQPDRNLYAVGCSFGALMLSNYLARVGEKTPLKTAATLCNPWDMVLSADKLQNDFWSRNLFSKSITQFLVRLVKVNMGELEVPEGTKPDHEPTVENPQFYTFTQSNLKKAFKMTKIIEFDNVFTAPCLGFKSGMDYYREATSLNRIQNVAIPLLAINSKDDPVVGDVAIPQEYLNKNSNVALYETDLGGHLSYIQSDGDSWSTRALAQFFDSFDKNVL